MAELITKADENAWWFVLSQGKLVALDKGNFIPFGCTEELPFPDGVTNNKRLLGKYADSPCYLVEVEACLDIGLGEYVTLRSLLGKPVIYYSRWQAERCKFHYSIKPINFVVSVGKKCKPLSGKLR